MRRFIRSFLLIFVPAICLGQAEIPIVVNIAQNAKVMLVIDDSGSMNAVMEHPNFDPLSSVATNTANTIPSVIFRLESGAAAPLTSHTLTPALIEINIGFNSSSSGNLYAGQLMSSPSSLSLVSSMTCNNTSGTAVCCPGTSGTGCPKTGINTGSLYGNSSVTGASIFQVANLAGVDTLGNEYLLMNYRKNDYERLTDNWADVWPKFDASGNLLAFYTSVYSTTGGTVVFNGKEVFLAAGWYRIEYLRWIFYGASATELTELPGATRLQTVKDVVTNLINDNTTVQFGIATLNGTAYTPGAHSGNLYTQWLTPDGDGTNTGGKIRNNIGTVNTTLISSLNGITAKGGTPIVNTLIEAYRYFGGVADADPNASLTYTSPITSQCDIHSVILLTDGLPTSETGKRLPNGNWVTNFDAFPNSGASSNNGCTATTCPTFGSDAAWWAYHNDLRSSVPGTQNLTTYTVGLGLDYSLLSNIAVSGGASQSYLVSTASEIGDTLQNIVNVIIQTPTSAAGLASIDKLYGAANVVQPIFFGDTWKGDLNVYNYNATNSTLDYSFNMADVLDQRDLSADPRNIIVGNDPDGDGRTNQTVDFNASNAGLLRPKLFELIIGGTVSSTILPPSIADVTQDSSAASLIQFLSGVAFNDMRVRDRNTDGYVDRLGDIVNSRPVEVGKKNGNYNSFSGYTDFLQSLDGQPRILLVGANDGMLHAFNSETGDELWAYIPSSIVKNLYKLSSTIYNRQLRSSYVDGQIAVEDVYISGQWRTYAMFGLRSGGSTYTVIDITDRDSPTLVWEVSDPTLGGQSWTKPTVVLSGGPSSSADPSAFNWYMVVGTGEGKTTAGNNLLVYSLSSSSPPAASVVTVSASEPAGARTSSPIAIQNDGDRNVDRIYLGTEEGDLYRIHVNGVPSGWTSHKLYDGTNARPIIAPPVAVLVKNPQYSASATSGIASMPLAIGVYFGTGKYDIRPDIQTYGTVSQRIIGIMDPVSTTTDNYSNALTNQTTSNLQNQGISTFAVVRNSMGEYQVPTNKAGFYMDLGTSINLTADGFIDPFGMVVNPPINVRGVTLFSTFKPDTGSCDIGGYGAVQGVNALTGGGAIVDYITDPTGPFYNGGIPDVNSDNAYSSSDLSQGFLTGLIQSVLDVHVESTDMTQVNPYLHDGELLQNDIRLHSSNGGILPAVSSLGQTGVASSVTLLASGGQIVVQPAYPQDPNGGSGGSGSGGSGSGSSGTGTIMPPPVNMPINLYNLPINVLSVHESTGE